MTKIKDKVAVDITYKMHNLLLKKFQNKYKKEIDIDSELYLATLFYSTTLMNIYGEGYQEDAISALNSCNSMIQNATLKLHNKESEMGCAH